LEANRLVSEGGADEDPFMLPGNHADLRDTARREVRRVVRIGQLCGIWPKRGAVLHRRCLELQRVVRAHLVMRGSATVLNSIYLHRHALQRAGWQAKRSCVWQLSAVVPSSSYL